MAAHKVIGRSVKRVEDARFLTGRGRYSDDLAAAGAAHAVFLRSPHAHAKIIDIDSADALASPGVLGVFTVADLNAEGIGHVPCLGPVTGKNGAETIVPPCPLLAEKRVRYVGEPVVLIVAETLDQARDAAELVAVDYDMLDSVEETAKATDPAAVQIWPEAPNNIGVDWEIGDAAATAAAFDQAAHVIALTVTNNRVAVSPLEPRAAVGEYDAQNDSLTLTTPTQGVQGVCAQLADHVFKLPQDRIRILTPDVGGGFGARFYSAREQIAVLWAARRTGRTVRWTADRNECFFADGHGRDHVSSGELALDGEGRFLALRTSSLANMGAFMKDWGPSIPTEIACEVLTGPYRIPAAHASVACVFTNTVPIDAYRGTGRAEAIYLLERLVDAAADQLGLSPAEIRRRNFIATDLFPYVTPTGQSYDSGDFQGTLERAMAAADWSGAAARKAAAWDRGKSLGIGMACYVMSAAGLFDESARLRLDEDGGISAFIGTQSSGQGHATAYSQMLSERFGLAMEKIRIIQGDSRDCPPGAGTGQSRSLLMGGLAIEGAAGALLDQAQALAGPLLQKNAGDLSYAEGVFRLPGSELGITLEQIAQARRDGAGDDGAAEPGPLESVFTAEQAAMTFPQGCHICELAVDPQTGSVEILNYSCADDFGRLMNPQLCEGQVHGGVVQGIGQALLERVFYEAGSGQLLTGSLMDYCLPRADDLPLLKVDLVEDAPCLTNALGVKGAGEAGPIAAPPAVINALLDALRPLGIHHIDMPATPDRIWTAIRRA